MAQDKDRLLSDLRRKKRSCTLGEAREAMEAWEFTPGGSKRDAEVWNYREVTVTLHRPHGKHMDPGAVAMVIRCIERAQLLQQQEEADADQES